MSLRRIQRIDAVVLRLQTIDIHAPDSDGEARPDGDNLKCGDRVDGNDSPAHDVHGLGAPATILELDELVPILVEHHSALLRQNAASILERTVSKACIVSSHFLLPCPSSRYVNNSAL